MNYKKNKLLNIYKNNFISILALTIFLSSLSFFSFFYKNEGAKLKFITTEVDNNKLVDIILQSDTSQDDKSLSMLLNVSEGKNLFFSGSFFGGSVQLISPVNGKYLQANFEEIFLDEVQKLMPKNLQVKVIEQGSLGRDLYTVTLKNGNKDQLLNIAIKLFNNSEMNLKNRILSKVSDERNNKYSNLLIIDEMMSTDFAKSYNNITKLRNNILKQTLERANLESLVLLKDRNNNSIKSISDLIVPTEKIKYGQSVLIFFIFHIMIVLVFLAFKSFKKTKSK